MLMLSRNNSAADESTSRIPKTANSESKPPMIQPKKSQPETGVARSDALAAEDDMQANLKSLCEIVLKTVFS